MITCKNCTTQFDGNYCPKCGQPAEVHPINFHFLWHDIQHGLLHLDKGISFTVKELFTRPGSSIREYLEGKRVKHFKPISLVLVLAGILGLLFHFFHIDILSDSITINGSDKAANHSRELLAGIGDWLAGHYAVVALIQVPFYALATFLAFKKMRYNFMEHIVINAFLTGQRLILAIVTFPLYYLFKKTLYVRSFSGVIDVIILILTLWTFFQVFPTVKKSSVFWRTLLSFLLFTILFYGTILLGVIAFGPRSTQ